MASLLLRSKVLPVPHGFSTRHGGVSGPPFATLNVGYAVGDDRAHVTENLHRLACAAEVPPGDLHTVSQVHGDAAVEAGPRAAEGQLPEVSGEADALWTARLGAAVGVKTADCVPLLIVDPDRRAVAAVHSGWRGTDARIASRTVALLTARGGAAQRLLCVIGPSIRACCYQVSEELAARFLARFGPEAIKPDPERPGPHLDLVHCVSQDLQAAGVKPAHLDVMPHCTSCEVDTFFSHRRDQGRTGRHLSFVQCRF